MYFKRYINFSREKCDQEISENKCNLGSPYYINTDYVECLNKYNTNNNRGKGKYYEIIQKICKQHNRNKGTKENRHIEHCTRTADSTDV